MVKRIKRARISFLSLVPKGANRLPGLYKSDDDDTLEWSPLFKAPEDFAEKGQLTALVYVPEHKDSQEHIASKSVISDMAHSFMEEGAKIDIRHDRKELKKNAAYIAESFIVQPGDPRFADFKDHLGKDVDATDGWGVVMQINDPDLRKAYRDGGWDGVSLYSYTGDYTLSDEGGDPVEKALEEFQRRLLKTEELTMDSKELAELLKENNKALVESLATVLKKEPDKKEPDKKDIKKDETGYQGDPTDIAALTKYHQALEISELQKEYDFTKPEQVKEYIAKVEEIKKSEKTDDTDDDAIMKEQIEKLEKELKDRKARSRTSDIKKEKTTIIDGLTKEESEAFAAGQAIADISNKNRGFTS